MVAVGEILFPSPSAWDKMERRWQKVTFASRSHVMSLSPSCCCYLTVHTCICTYIQTDRQTCIPRYMQTWQQATQRSNPGTASGSRCRSFTAILNRALAAASSLSSSWLGWVPDLDAASPSRLIQGNRAEFLVAFNRDRLGYNTTYTDCI